MWRKGGIVVLLVGVVVAAWAFNRPVRYEYGYVIEEGRREPAFVECGDTVSVLRGSYQEDVRTRGERRGCDLAARTNVVNAGLVLLAAVFVGGAAILRGPFPDIPLYEQVRRFTPWRRHPS